MGNPSWELPGEGLESLHFTGFGFVLLSFQAFELMGFYRMGDQIALCQVWDCSRKRPIAVQFRPFGDDFHLRLLPRETMARMMEASPALWEHPLTNTRSTFSALMGKRFR